MQISLNDTYETKFSSYHVAWTLSPWLLCAKRRCWCWHGAMLLTAELKVLSAQPRARALGDAATTIATQKVNRRLNCILPIVTSGGDTLLASHLIAAQTLPPPPYKMCVRFQDALIDVISEFLARLEWGGSAWCHWERERTVVRRAPPEGSGKQQFLTL